jgi:hypothetical protein
MEANESTGVFFGIVLIALFVASFLAGDIAGIIIERHSARKWRIAAEKLGFEFDGRKRRAQSLSEIFLPKLLFPEAQETAFSFCQIMKSLSGGLQGLNISINDLTVWDYHTRGPMIYRSVVCIINGYDAELTGPIGLVRIGSILFNGFGQDKTLKEYTLSEEDSFSTTYRVFGRGSSSLSIFTQDLRRFCVEQRRSIDCLLINAEEMILVWTSDSPEYFPQLVDLATAIVSKVLDPAQQID